MPFPIPPYAYGNPAAMGGFNPLSLAPSLWLDASQLADADDTTLATWNDLSGNGIDFTATGTNAANLKVRTNVQNGLRIVRFPGSDANFSCAGDTLASVITASAGTLFAVAKITTNDAPVAGEGSQDRTLFSEVQGYFSFGHYNNTPLVGIRNFDTNNDLADVAADTSFHVWQGRHDVGSIYFQQDSGSEASSVSGNTDVTSGTLLLGTNYQTTVDFIGDVGEFLVFGSVLSLANRTAVFNYLKAKWGTP